MTDAADGSDDEFADHLAALDEAIAGGSTQFPFNPALQTVLRSRLERELASLQQLHRLRPGREPAPARVGRFKIVRELGRGGFGVVFLASDPLLSREVALKIPHPGLLNDAGALERFRREGRAAAGLSHPNVVPVYNTGEVGPVLFTVAAYCPGGDLAEWLRRNPGPVAPPAAAALVAAVAAGVEHAHLRGVLHRDLKPANVLLEWPAGAPDNDLAAANPLVADFGLARLADADGVTVSRAVLGTPAYMAPETTGPAPALGPAVDVYSLGAVLYELLTGRPAFRGDTPLATLDLVRHTEPPRPSRLCPGVPRDLETICLKCLEKEPARRYPSAVALGDDLHRFLTGRPVTARRLGAVPRLWRAARRNPTTAVLVGTLVVALAGGLVGVLTQWHRAESLAAANARERDAAQAAQTLAERDFARAQGAVDRLAQLGEELTNRPDTAANGRAVLEEALTFYQQFLDDRPTSPEVRHQVARACYRVGDICYRLGRYPQADEAYRRAAALLEGLVADAPVRKDLRRTLVRGLRDHGNMLRDDYRPAEAARVYERAIELSGADLAADPGDPVGASEHAFTLVNQAVALRALGEHARAESACREALRIQNALLTAAPESLALRSQQGHAHDTLSLILPSRGDRPGAERECLRALDLRAEVVAARPDDFVARRYLGRSYARLAHLHAAAGRREEADAEYRKAVDLLDRAATDHPTSPHGRIEQIILMIDWAEVLTAMERLDAAERVGQDARALAETVSAAHPADARLAQRVARAWVALGDVSLAGGSYPAAAERYERAVRVQPDRTAALNGVAWATACDRAAKGAARTRAVELALRTTELAPEEPAYWNTLGACLYRAGEPVRAADAIRKAVTLYRARGEASPFDGLYLALCALGTGDHAAAREAYNRAAAEAAAGDTPAPSLRQLLDEVKSLLEAAPNGK